MHDNAKPLEDGASDRGSRVVTSEALIPASGDVRDYIRQLQALYALTDALVRADDLPAMYAAALDALARAVGCDRAAVLLFDPDGVMRFKAHRGLSDAYRRAVEGHSPWSRDAADAVPIAIDEVLSDPSLDALRDTITGEGIHALAFVPLLFGGALLGKFMLYYDAPHAFTVHELRLAETIARHVAVAVARRRDADRLSLYREIFANSADGIALIDERGAYLEQNAAHAALLGYSDDELAGRTPAVHLGDEAFAVIARELRDSGRSRARVASRSRDGAELAIDLSAFGVRDAAGNTTYVGIKRNVTEEEALRRRTEALADELRRALEARQEFLSIASHELRTPVAALSLQLDTMTRAEQRGALDDLSTRLAAARRQVVKLTRLIEQLLDLSRIDAGRAVIHREPLDFATAFRETTERFRGELERVSCTFTVECPASVDGVCDAQRFEQVLANLLSNAAKYGAGTPVAAVLEADEREVRVRVRDGGIGIAREDHARVFERFERAVSERRYGGFGLGLFITRELVTALGGTIALESAPGAGSTFTVTLPRR